MRTPLLPWFILWVTIPIIIFFLFILPAHASDGPFYQRGQEGWFWYQAIPEPAESEPSYYYVGGSICSKNNFIKLKHYQKCHRNWVQISYTIMKNY